MSLLFISGWALLKTVITYHSTTNSSPGPELETFVSAVEHYHSTTSSLTIFLLFSSYKLVLDLSRII